MFFSGSSRRNVVDEHALRAGLLVSGRHLREIHSRLLQRGHGGHPAGRRHPLRPAQEVVAGRVQTSQEAEHRTNSLHDRVVPLYLHQVNCSL